MGKLQTTTVFYFKKPPRNRMFENATTNFLKETSIIKKITKKNYTKCLRSFTQLKSLRSSQMRKSFVMTLLVTWQLFVCNFTVKIYSTLPVFIYSFIRNVMIAWIISSEERAKKRFTFCTIPVKKLLLVFSKTVMIQTFIYINLLVARFVELQGCGRAWLKLIGY